MLLLPTLGFLHPGIPHYKDQGHWRKHEPGCHPTHRLRASSVPATSPGEGPRHSSPRNNHNGRPGQVRRWRPALPALQRHLHLEKHLLRAQQGLQVLFAPLCHLPLVWHWVGAAPRSTHLASYLCPSSRGLRGMEAGKEATGSWGGGYA